MSTDRITVNTRIEDIKVPQDFVIIMNSVRITTVGKLLKTLFHVLMNNRGILRNWDTVIAIVSHCKAVNLGVERTRVAD